MSFESRHYQDQEQRRRIAASRATQKEPTTEQLRAYLDRESMSVEQEAAKEREEKACHDWVAVHPEYKVNPQSAAMMREYLEARDLKPSAHTLDAAFAYLSKRGFIETNEVQVEGDVQKRAKEAELQRRASQVKPIPTSEEAYSMSLEELKKLADQQLQDGGQLPLSGE